MKHSIPMVKRLTAVLLGLSLLACQDTSSPDALALSGQVGSAGGSQAKLSHYAASRLLDQASMGPSPASVAQVRTLGAQAWIDEQLKTVPSQIVTPPALYNFDNNDREATDRAWSYKDGKMYGLLIGGQDQLRLRTTWVLSNFLVVSTRKIDVYGASEYFNTLQRQAFGSYADLLRAVTLSPAMGRYLDNDANNNQQLNENFGRELMQLFSVGLVKLNPDGSVQRDAQRKPIETYSQKDVIEATRALTGWEWAEANLRRPGSNFANYGKPMVPRPGSHDTGAKTVLGKTIPAGQTAAQDLDSLIEILVQHPNTAPFVSLRLIQGLTTSEPSPAYLARVAQVFTQTRGQLDKVITAILLDAEARQGDDPARSSNSFGRIKDPLQLHVAVLRGLECQAAVRDRNNPESYWKPWGHEILHAPSVFNFQAPNHRSPNSQLLAPEQKSLSATEFGRRVGDPSWRLERETELAEAGCQLEPFKAAAAQGDQALAQLIGERYFRGTIPASTAKGLIDGGKNFWNRSNPMALTGAFLDIALITPGLGVSK